MTGIDNMQESYQIEHKDYFIIEVDKYNQENNCIVVFQIRE